MVFALALMVSACAPATETPVSDQLADIETDTTTSTAVVDESTETSVPAAATDSAASTLCTSVEEMPAELYVSFEWEAGEARNLVREFTRARPDSGTQTATTPVTLTAIDVTSERTSLAWEYGTTELLGASPAEAALLDSLTPPRIEYSIDSSGIFESISNIAEMRSYLSNATTELVDTGGLDAATAAQIQQSYDGLSDEQFTISVGEEIAVFHEFDGFTIAPGSSEETSGVIPNPWGARPFDAAITVSAEPDFDSENCAAISIVTVPDPDSTPTVLAETVSEAFGVDGAAADQVFEDFVVRNEVTVQLDVATSLLRRVTSTQSITTFGQQAIDTKSVTYVE